MKEKIKIKISENAVEYSIQNILINSNALWRLKKILSRIAEYTIWKQGRRTVQVVIKILQIKISVSEEIKKID